MISRKFVLIGLIGFIVIFICRSHLIGYAEETPLPDTAEKLQNTHEQDELITQITNIKAELEKERENYRDTTGEEHLLAWTQVSEKLIGLSEQLDILIDIYLKQRENGYDISKLSMLVKDFVLAESGYVRGDISEIRDSYFDLREKTSDIKTEKIFEYQHALEKQQDNYQRLLSALLANIARKQKVGLDASDDNQYIDTLLKEVVVKSKARLQMAMEKEKIVDKQIAYAAEEDKPGFRTQRQLLAVNKKMAALALSRIIPLINARGIETTEYSELLITTTGEISKEILDTDVAVGLLERWTTIVGHWLKEKGPSLLLKGLLLVLILFIIKVLSTIAGKLARKAIATSKLSFSQLLQDFLISILKKGVWIIGILIALTQMEIQIGPLLAGLGLAGFIVGFALQDTLSNFVSGLMILIYKPFDVDDFVEVGGVFGEVKYMTLVSTTILTPDNQRLILPNNKIWGDIIKNITAEKVRRIDMVFGIGYCDDVAHAEAVLKEIVKDEEAVLDYPEPMVKVYNLGESSVDFIVRPWVSTSDYWDVKWRITRCVKERFDKEGISIPFPQRDIYIKQSPPLPT